MTPHDEFFKSLMSDKKMAMTYCNHFLPPEIVTHLDLEKLKLTEESYITDELKNYYSDIVYTCPYKSEDIYLTLLLEHKSSPVAYPHLQLLRYQLEIWEKQVEAKQPLRAVLPIVFYNGKTEWKYRDFSTYFQFVDEMLLPFLPDFNYILTDLTQYSDEELFKIKEHFFVNSILTMKYRGDLQFIFSNLQLVETNKKNFEIRLFRKLIVYIFRANNIKGEEVDDLLNKLENVTDMETIYKHLYERYKKEHIHELSVLVQQKMTEINLITKENKRILAERKKIEQAKQKIEQAKQKAEQAKQKAEQAKQKAEQAKQKAEQAKQKAEQAKQKAEQRFINGIKNMLTKGFDKPFVADAFGVSIEELEKLMES